jgi:hypothetical protein
MIPGDFYKLLFGTSFRLCVLIQFDIAYVDILAGYLAVVAAVASIDVDD